MALSKITVNVGEGGLGRRAPNEDKISSIIYYNNTLPSGFTASTRSQKVLTLSQAEAKGIVEGDVNHGVEWYHISEYFRANTEGELWIHYAEVPAGAYDFAEIDTLASDANGEIRQISVYANALAWDSSQVTTIQAQATIIDGKGFYADIFYACDFSAVTDWTAETNLRTLVARKVHVVVAQDGAGAGKALFDSKGYSITALGACLGMVSKSGVQQSIGNPANFNASNGVELETLALANGDLANDNTILGTLKDNGYVILRKYLPQIAGSYFERVPSAITATSDFAWLESNRTIDKAIRFTESILAPELQKDLLLNTDGTLSDDVIGYFQDLVKGQLERMQADGEISDKNVLIDPNQDILSTSTLEVSIQILPLGIAEFITVNIGLTTSL